jgi:hypothetical protein
MWSMPQSATAHHDGATGLALVAPPAAIGAGLLVSCARRARPQGPIVALARKLLVALWKYVKHGVAIEGAVMKPAV